MKVSDLFVKCLENEGVKYVFGVPGEEFSCGDNRARGLRVVMHVNEKLVEKLKKDFKGDL